MFCYQCGAQVEDGLAFCTNCGTKLIKEDAPQTVKAEPAQEVEQPVVINSYVQTGGTQNNSQSYGQNYANNGQETLASPMKATPGPKPKKCILNPRNK